ncbi:AFG3-like protein 2, partial [Limulus polyphemus]|uniref:AFG3-like protein 2 n=1 Tax=Limulus polyphemus TaxID=6850 RepID=A0ABM1BU00_LIMPO
MAHRFMTVSKRFENIIARTVLNKKITLTKLQICQNLEFLHKTPEALSFRNLLHQWRHLCEHPPKGFEKYFPGGKKTSSNAKSGEKSHNSRGEPKEQPKDAPSKSSPQKPSSGKQDSQWPFNIGSSFSGGSNKGGRNPFSPDDQNRLMTIALVTTMGVLGLLAFNEMRYKEITWKEFVNTYLARGGVEKLEVINKKWVKVKLLPGNAVDGNVSVHCLFLGIELV